MTDPAKALQDTVADAADLNNAERTAVMTALGISLQPDPYLDELAQSMAHAAGAAVGAFNIIDGNRRQNLIGLYTAPGIHIDRTLAWSSGVCPYVVESGGIVVGDLASEPAFCDSLAVSEANLHAYAGEQMIYTHTPFGTACVADPNIKYWTLHHLKVLKPYAAKAVDHLAARHQPIAPR